MGRPREFDQDVALRKAMELFWERGYGATSMDNLVEHLGIGRASLYAAFGSKHELFLRALDAYIQERVTRLTEVMSQPGPVLPAVRNVIGMFITRSLDPERPGCLVANTATELSSRDPQAARKVQQSWTALETALATTLARARAQGELPPERDPHALASFLLVFIQGVLVVGKGDPDPNRLRTAADQALSILQ